MRIWEAYREILYYVKKQARLSRHWIVVRRVAVEQEGKWKFSQLRWKSGDRQRQQNSTTQVAAGHQHQLNTLTHTNTFQIHSTGAVKFNNSLFIARSVNTPIKSCVLQPTILWELFYYFHRVQLSIATKSPGIWRRTEPSGASLKKQITRKGRRNSSPFCLEDEQQ